MTSKLQQVRDVIAAWHRGDGNITRSIYDAMNYIERIVFTDTPAEQERPMSDVPTDAKDFGLQDLSDGKWIERSTGGVLALTFADQMGPFRTMKSIPFTRDDVIKALMAYFEANRGEGATHDN